MRINNRRYLGNKYKLLPFITNVVKENCNDINVVFDVFAGTGAVSSAFIDKQLITNDLLYSNYLAHICWFSNEKYNQDKIFSFIEKYNNSNPKKENYMSENFSNTFFSREVCLKIGYIRDDIDKQFKKGNINTKERAMLITSLLYACDKIANTCGHYDAYRIGAEYDDNLVLEYPEQYNSLKNNLCLCEDSNKIASTIRCDLAYLDPPYNSRQYGDAYHLLENIAKWEKPKVYGTARKMNRDNLKSKYCLRSSAVETFEDLINKLDCKYILLSYNNTSNKANDRSNARISDEDIMRILSKKGKVKVFTQKYKAFTTGKSKNNDNEERLFLCITDKKTIASPLNYTGGKAKLLEQIKPLFPLQINNFIDLFCGGCNVGINVEAGKYLYNDINSELIGLFKTLQTVDIKDLLKDLNRLIKKYELSNTDKNGYEFYGTNSNDGLADYNKVPYSNLKKDFNNYKEVDLLHYEMLYLLIVFGFNNQIRFNSKGEFNLPVGKRDFNKQIKKKLICFSSKLKNQNAEFLNLDFKKYEFKENDFIYADPPYLITTASYNENGGWSKSKEKELLDYLKKADGKGVKFALSNVLTHKGKINDLLIEWANKNNFNIHHLNKNYNNSNYHTSNKDKKTDEVLITNYE